MATSPASLQADELLEQLWHSKGTDLLVSPGLTPRVRVDGDLGPIDGCGPVSVEEIEDLLKQMATPAQALAFESGDELTSRSPGASRPACAATPSGPRARSPSPRLIPHEIPTFEDLGPPPVFERFAGLRQGLVLVTGPTGAGKSTTLASMLDRINAERACHIITVEEPIEYVYQNRRAVVHQREVGDDTESFPSALRSALREDPDVLLVGEMCDLESISFALALAEHGHLVFATPHTNDTARRSTASSTSSCRTARRRSACSWPTRSPASSTSGCCPA
jgi:twitching motility protein PilT